MRSHVITFWSGERQTAKHVGESRVGAQTLRVGEYPCKDDEHRLAFVTSLLREFNGRVHLADCGGRDRKRERRRVLPRSSGHHLLVHRPRFDEASAVWKDGLAAEAEATAELLSASSLAL
jgi:hypothetical protein